MGSRPEGHDGGIGLSSAGVSLEPDLLAEAVSQELAAMLQVGSYDAVKLLLEPVQPVDIAEAIGSLPANLQAIAFRLLSKDEAISVYEYLDTATQQACWACALRRNAGGDGGDVAG